MCGADIQQDTLFSTVIPEERVPADHPLRPIREMVNAALKEMDADFDALHSDVGRDSIAPEKLLSAQLVMAFYTIRSERQLMEQIDYNLLFRWFVGISMDDKVWNHNDSNRSSAIYGRTTRHPGYGTSQTIRKRIEECFGWAKTIGGLCKSRFIGRDKLDFQFVMTFAAYNLIQMRNLGVVPC